MDQFQRSGTIEGHVAKCIAAQVSRIVACHCCRCWLQAGWLHEHQQQHLRLGEQEADRGLG